MFKKLAEKNPIYLEKNRLRNLLSSFLKNFQINEKFKKKNTGGIYMGTLGKFFKKSLKKFKKKQKITEKMPRALKRTA